MSWLKDRRLKVGASQQYIADRLGITRITYARIEQAPDLLTLRQVAILNAEGLAVDLTNFTTIDCPACDGSGILYRPTTGKEQP